jgi:neprilysin
LFYFKISTQQDDFSDPEALYNRRTIAQLQEEFNYIDWLKYINILLPLEVFLQPNDSIIVVQPSFLVKLGDLLNSTDARILENYIKWRQVKESVDYLPQRFRYNQPESKSDPQWKFCLDEAKSYFKHAISALYVRKHADKDSRRKVSEIVKNIKNEFKEIINNVNWMDKITKKTISDKIEKMTEHIGFDDKLLNDTKIEEYYKTIKVDETKFYETVLGLNDALRTKNYKELIEPVDKNDWDSLIMPTAADAFYDLLNIINIPSSMLQSHFFNADRPQYMNYGAIGMIIGHEISHAFDNLGIKYDADGNFENWLSETVENVFEKKSECIVDQYGKYTEPQTRLKLNGTNTQGENIADNSGIKAAYLAYIRWAETKNENKLPGFNFTNHQMFWISAAQNWCIAYSLDEMKKLVSSGSHSPDQFRVNGMMSNSNEFAKDFICAENSPMNPTQKCEIW